MGKQQNQQEVPKQPQQSTESQPNSQQSLEPDKIMKVTPDTVTKVTPDGEIEEMTWAEFRTWYNRQEDTSTKVDKMYRRMFPEEFQEEQDKESLGLISPQGSEETPEEPKSKLPKGFFSQIKNREA